MFHEVTKMTQLINMYLLDGIISTSGVAKEISRIE